MNKSIFEINRTIATFIFEQFKSGKKDPFYEIHLEMRKQNITVDSIHDFSILIECYNSLWSFIITCKNLSYKSSMIKSAKKLLNILEHRIIVFLNKNAKFIS